MNYQYDLLSKSELKVTRIELSGVDLTRLAAVAADVLVLEPNEVLVTDYLDNVVTFDVLRPSMYPHQLLGRSEALLTALAGVSGVTLSPESRVTADGMLGWIAADPEQLAAAMEGAQRIAEQIEERIRSRVGVFSTGAELVNGEVKDTNWIALSQALTAAGLRCEYLGALPDDQQLITGSIRRAIDEGHGVIITTGGVGAEAKDFTVEAIQALIPDAVTPYTSYFTAGHGRHVKDGVRIAVGTYRGSRVVALPGPNDEVRECLGDLVTGLNSGTGDAPLANAIAERLRAKLRDRMAGSHE
ncbi:MAG: molybdenum cofactor synthesis domain-containing protein [Mycobacterium sp.]